MTTMYDTYERMKAFVGFSDQDVENLKGMAPLFAQHGAAITDGFYDTLGKVPETAKLIEGRVDQLKATHSHWMAQLFGGDYGEAYFERRRRIGEAHVRIGLPPEFVEGVMSYIRIEGERLVRASNPDAERAASQVASLVRILDLDLIVINLAYAEERIELMSKITGMRRNLIENLIRQGQKKKGAA